MATVKLLLDTRSKKANNTYPVKLYIHHRGDFMISTNISVTAEEWIGDEKKPTTVKFANSALLTMLASAKATIYSLRADGTIDGISNLELKKMIKEFKTLEEVKTDTSPITDLRIEVAFNKFIELSRTTRTKDIYLQTLRKIQKFYDVNHLTFEEVSVPWLREFEGKMREDGLSVNAISVHLRNLRAVFNRALDDELITNYPFRKFKIKTEKTVKRSLTVEQLCTLRDYDCQPHQAKYRDVFMLILYMIGINMVDLLALKEIRDGRVEFRRAKTGRLYSIKVEPEALEIIERYRGEEFLLSACDNYANYRDFLKRMNKNLQEIGPWEWVENGARDPLFVKKNKKKITPLFSGLSTYWARHTWATIAASLDVTKETIAAALGHGGNTTTDIYIDFDQRKVDSANRRVIDYVNEL